MLEIVPGHDTSSADALRELAQLLSYVEDSFQTSDMTDEGVTLSCWGASGLRLLLSMTDQALLNVAHDLDQEWLTQEQRAERDRKQPQG